MAGNRFVTWRWVSWCALFIAPLAAATAADRDPATLLPPTTLATLSFSHPAAVADFVLEHPLYQRFQQSPQYQQLLLRKEYVQGRLMLGVVELRLGKSWRNALESLAGGGATVAFDPASNGAVLLAKSTDEVFLSRSRESLLEFAKGQNQGRGVERSEHRGIAIDNLDKVQLAVLGPWLVVSSDGGLLQNVIDRWFDEGASLAANARWLEATAKRPQDAAVWSWVDLLTLRESGQAKQLFRGQAEDFGGELLIGGILGALSRTRYLAGALELTTWDARLSFAIPFEKDWVSGPREHFFGAGAQGRAPGLLLPDSTLLSVSAYRDLKSLWLQAGDLFDEATNDGLAAAESQLTTLFAGRDFGEEILGALRPELQLVVARQQFTKPPMPAVRLPSFALVAELREPERMERELRRIFQSLIGFLNVVGAMQGQPQLDVERVRDADGLELTVATYVAEPDEEQSERARIQFNFSPTLAFREGRLILSSSETLARQLAGAKAQASDEAVNTRLHALGPAIRSILLDNRGQLIAQNMLTKGQSQEEAAKELDTALTLLESLREVDLRLLADDQLRLELRVGLRKSEGEQAAQQPGTSGEN